MVCEYLTEFSPCRDHLKVPNRVIEVSGKTCFEANFQFYTVWHCNQNYVHQEAENSVRYSQTIDNQYTKRTRFPDQPFGLGDSWSAGKFMTFQALFSRPAEFGPYTSLHTRIPYSVHDVQQNLLDWLYPCNFMPQNRSTMTQPQNVPWNISAIFYILRMRV